LKVWGPEYRAYDVGFRLLNSRFRFKVGGYYAVHGLFFRVKMVGRALA